MSFDLNIENYTRDELIEMFELPSNFDKNILEIKEAKLRDSILNNNQISKDVQKNTLDFIFKAKNSILNNKTENNLNKMAVDNLKLYSPSFKQYYELEPSELEEQAPKGHPIQVRFEHPHIPSYPSEFYPGPIDPLHKRLTRKSVVINSKFRDNYYSTSSSNFNFQLPTNFNDVLQINLTQISLPISYFAISKQHGNNFFNITVTPIASLPSSTVIKIPDGNYDPIGVIAAVNSALIAAGTPFNLITFAADLNGATLKPNYYIGSGKTLVGEITAGTVESYELNFQANSLAMPDEFTPLTLKFGWMLGFRNGIYKNNLNYVSEGIIDVSGPKYIYLALDDYNNNVSKNFYSAFNSSILNNNIFGQFAVSNTSPYTVYQNSFTDITCPPREYFGPVNLNNFNVQLMDEYGRILDLNNMDFSFTLLLTCVHNL